MQTIYENRMRNYFTVTFKIKKWFYMKYIGKYLSAERLLIYHCMLAFIFCRDGLCHK